MKILAIDTSSKYLSLAVAEGEKVTASFHRDMEQQHCAQLIPQIDKLLKKAKLRLKDVGCIAFSKGPGSFTALRIGAATVKGLALAAKMKIVGVPTLDIIAYNLKESYKLVVPIVDARRGNVYASIYSFKNGRAHRHFKYSVIPIGELLKYIKSDAVFLGDGLVVYKKDVESGFKFKAGFAPRKDWYPKATAVARLALDLIKNRKFEDTDKFVPMYLYPRDVTVTKKR